MAVGQPSGLTRRPKSSRMVRGAPARFEKAIMCETDGKRNER